MRLVVALFALVILAQAAVANAQGYAVIAYSPSAGVWSTGCDDDSNVASNFAVQNCGYSDCVVKTWAFNGYVAFATGDAGWAASGAMNTAADAVNNAMALCEGFSANCSEDVWVGNIDGQCVSDH